MKAWLIPACAIVLWSCGPVDDDKVRDSDEVADTDAAPDSDASPHTDGDSDRTVDTDAPTATSPFDHPGDFAALTHLLR